MSKLLLGLALFGLLSTSALAVPVTVGNFSFESPTLAPQPGGIAPGVVGAPWGFLAGPTAFGTWAVPPAIATPANGTQVLYIGGGSGVLQTNLGAVSASTTYTLTVAVGRRADAEPGTVYTLELWAGGQQLGVFSGSTVGGTGGTLTDQTLSVTTLATVPSGQLEIHLTGGATSDTAGQSLLDNVRLDVGGGVTPPPPGGVPEPATMALLGSGLAVFGFMRRRRNAVR